MYTIKRAAELAGLSASTVRAWERRYGIPQPERTTSRYRVYSSTDVDLLIRMSELVRAGTPPSRAAALIAEGEAARESTLTPAEFLELVLAGEQPHTELAILLESAETHRTWARIADDWLMPMLIGLGRAWESGEVSLLQEHEFSAVVMHHLVMAYRRAVPPPDGATVLLGLPTGERHEIGLLLFAVLLRTLGVEAHYLGADLSPEAWLAAAAHHRPGLVITARYQEDDGAAQQLVDRLGAAGLRVAIGGGRQDEIVGAEHLGHQFSVATSLAAALGRR